MRRIHSAWGNLTLCCSSVLANEGNVTSAFVLDLNLSTFITLLHYEASVYL